MTSNWSTRYPDLSGKTAILAGASPHLVEIASALGANQMLLAVVAADRATVERAVAAAQTSDTSALGFTTDPADPATWERLGPHIEQRLGPIDVLVVIAPELVRRTVQTALLPDMAARNRGVIVELGAQVEPSGLPGALRHRAISGGAQVDPADLAAAVLLAASDTLTAGSVTISISD